MVVQSNERTFRILLAEENLDLQRQLEVEIETYDTVEQFLSRLGICRATFYDRVRDGTFRITKIGKLSRIGVKENLRRLRSPTRLD